MNDIASARRIAKAALPPEVYAHTLRVVERIKGDTVEVLMPRTWASQYTTMYYEIVVAYLHDVLEDSEWTLTDLIESGFDEFTVDAVEVLTRHPLVTYTEYIERVKRYGGAAKAVKIADLEDHLAEADTLKPSLKTRYDRALDTLSTGVDSAEAIG